MIIERKFTAEEMDIARGTSVTELASSLGYTVIRHGSWHTLKEAPHIVIKANNKYFDNYKQTWGDAITFMQEFGNMNFAEAVESILEAKGALIEKPSPKDDQLSKKDNTEFKLPVKSTDYKRVYSYLRKRGISHQVICAFLDSGLLYEDEKHHNCVFVGRDDTGNAVFANIRGTYDKGGVGFKGDIAGSNKDIAFRLPCDSALDMVRVYESPIDLMSDMTMRRYIRSNCVALCCLHDGALETYLKEYPHIKTIDLCLDNDKWGRQAAAQMKEKYEKLGYTVHDHIPPKGKDINEYLQIKNTNKRERRDER